MEQFSEMSVTDLTDFVSQLQFFFENKNCVFTFPQIYYQLQFVLNGE